MKIYVNTTNVEKYGCFEISMEISKDSSPEQVVLEDCARFTWGEETYTVSAFWKEPGV